MIFNKWGASKYFIFSTNVIWYFQKCGKKAAYYVEDIVRNNALKMCPSSFYFKFCALVNHGWFLHVTHSHRPHCYGFRWCFWKWICIYFLGFSGLNCVAWQMTYVKCLGKKNWWGTKYLISVVMQCPWLNKVLRVWY